MNLLTEIFSHLCGQGRCFVIDGAALPVCQRCLGLYVGALVTLACLAASGAWRRGLPSRSIFAVNVAALLAAILGGLHVLDFGPLWRLACGMWTGQVATLWLIGGSVHLWQTVGTTHNLNMISTCGTAAHGCASSSDITDPFTPEGGRATRPGAPAPAWRRGEKVQALAVLAALTALAFCFDWAAPLGWTFWSAFAGLGLAALAAAVAIGLGGLAWTLIAGLRQALKGCYVSRL